MTVTGFKLAIAGRDDKRKRIKGFYSSRSGNQPVISRTVTECVSISFHCEDGM